jgi:hypothetical protein
VFVINNSYQPQMLLKPESPSSQNYNIGEQSSSSSAISITGADRIILLLPWPNCANSIAFSLLCHTFISLVTLIPLSYFALCDGFCSDLVLSGALSITIPESTSDI